MTNSFLERLDRKILKRSILSNKYFEVNFKTRFDRRIRTYHWLHTKQNAWRDINTRPYQALYIFLVYIYHIYVRPSNVGIDHCYINGFSRCYVKINYAIFEIIAIYFCSLITLTHMYTLFRVQSVISLVLSFSFVSY